MVCGASKPAGHSVLWGGRDQVTLVVGTLVGATAGTAVAVRTTGSAGMERRAPILHCRLSGTKETPAVWDEQRNCYTVGGRSMPPGFRPATVTKFGHVRNQTLQCECRHGGGRCSVVLHNFSFKLTPQGLVCPVTTS